MEPQKTHPGIQCKQGVKKTCSSLVYEFSKYPRSPQSIYSDSIAQLCYFLLSSHSRAFLSLCFCHSLSLSPFGLLSLYTSLKVIANTFFPEPPTSSQMDVLAPPLPPVFLAVSFRGFLSYVAALHYIYCKSSQVSYALDYCEAYNC